MAFLNTARAGITAVGALVFFGLRLLGEDQIAGAELIERSGSATEVLNELTALPLEAGELEDFLANAEPVLSWAGANPELWEAADRSERPLDAIRAFPIWESVGVPASGFVATLVKLLFLSQFAEDPESLDRLETEIEQMESAIESGNLTGYVLEMAHREIERKRQRVRLLKGALPRNLKLYKANQERIDSVLDRFAAIGE